MKLGTKLLAAFLLVGIIPFAVLGFISLNNSTKSLSHEAFSQLESIRDIKADSIERFLDAIKDEINMLDEVVRTLRKDAFDKLKAVQKIKQKQINDYFKEAADDVSLLTKRKSINKMIDRLHQYKDTMKIGATEPFNISSSEYQKIYDDAYFEYSDYTKIYGYYDMMIISSASGQVMFTLEKEKDLGTNLAHGPYKDSNIAKLWQRVVSTKSIIFEDFKPYAPSNNEPCAFIGAPSFNNETGELNAVIVLQIPFVQISNIVKERTGMGKTGEIYLVGPDKLMRSDSFLDPVNHSIKASFANPEKGIVDTEASNEALSGKEGAKVINDYNGNPVLSAYSPVKILGTTWAIIAEIDVSEAFAPVDEEGNEFFVKYNETFDYPDVYLINPDGYIFYTSTKGADNKINILKGKFSSSNLGKLVKHVIITKQPYFTDIELYPAKNNIPAAFAAQPVINNDKVECIVAVQLPYHEINNIMKLRAGMGKSGESYLVGPDKRMRSDSYLDKDGHSIVASLSGTIEKNGVDTKSSTEALSGKSGIEIIKDYNGNSVLSAYKPIKFGDSIWACIVEIDESEAFDAITKLQKLMAVVAFIGVLAIVIVSLLISQSITKPVKSMVAGLNLVSKGDLTIKVDVDSHDEIGEMAKSFNNTVKSLNFVMKEIQEAANQTAASGEELSASAQNISQGAQSQASSLEEISATVQELTSAVTQIAENAQDANNNSVETINLAREGSSTVKTSREGMNLINESSTQISKIIGVISQIANQTNLLALNAAIEAASAGEHGLGFAVVADEVRKLAERSSQAAGEITQLIEESTKRVNEGSRLSDEVGKSLNNILSGIDRTSVKMAAITSSTEEQAEATQQVSKAIENVSGITESNSSSAEELAASSEELSAQAQKLQNLVERFKVNSSEVEDHEIKSSVKKIKLKDILKKRKKDKPEPESKQPELTAPETSSIALYHE
ncbi:MAG: methyl-accepting chemotaxis protein [Desulfobacterales bacterium]|nr:methyl-accepting chemotaxis protein [Desulfobacterales bacterium]